MGTPKSTSDLNSGEHISNLHSTTPQHIYPGSCSCGVFSNKMSDVDSMTPVVADLPAATKPVLTPEETEAKKAQQKARRLATRLKREEEDKEMDRRRRETMEELRAVTEEDREDALMKLRLLYKRLRSLYATIDDIGNALFLADPELTKLEIQEKGRKTGFLKTSASK